MSTQPKPRLTPAEYLARERSSAHKSEFFAGEVFAMAGDSRAHNLIVGNLVAALHEQLRGRRCEVYPSDMRVKVEPSDLYTYPDVSVVCGGPVFEDERADTLLNPTLLIEVLPESTEAYDRGTKAARDRQPGSLQEYVLVSQDRIQVEVLTRSDAAFWMLTEISERDAAVRLTSIDCELIAGRVYERVLLGE